MLLLEQFHNLTLNPANAARLKELVLQLAVQGKLTEAWRKENPNVEPVSELLKKIGEEKEQLVKEKKIKNDNTLRPLLEETVPFELATEWEWCRLADLLALDKYSMKRGPFGSALRKDFFVEEGYKVYEQGNAIYNDAERGRYYITKEKYQELKAFAVVPKDLIISCSGTIGRIAEIPSEAKEGIINQALLKIKLNDVLILNDFFILLFNSRYIQDNILDKATGSAIQNMVGVAEIKNILIPLPPIDEQKAIVARVKELFKNIEALQEKTAKRIELKKQLGTAALQNLTTAAPNDLPQYWQFLKENFGTILSEATNVKKLRETILQLAVQGKLTQAWRHQNPNPEPASELLKRIQTEKEQLIKDKKFKKEQPLESIDINEVPFELPKSWSWIKLGSITYTFGQKQPDQIFQYIDVASVDNNKGFIFHDLQTIMPNEAPSRARKIVKPGCVIYSTVRPYLLNIAIVEKDYAPEAIASTAFAILNPIPSLDKKYLFYYLRSIPFINYVESQQIGVAYPAINDSKLYEGLVPFPPSNEQEVIVTKVDELMQLCDELENQIEHSRQETEALMLAVVQEGLKITKKEELLF